MSGYSFRRIENFIEKSMRDSNYVQLVFKMDFVTKMFKEQLTQLIGTNAQLCMSDIQTSYLRWRIFAHFPYLAEYISVRGYILAYDRTVAGALLQTCKDHHNADAHALLHVTKTIKKKMCFNI